MRLLMIQLIKSVLLSARPSQQKYSHGHTVMTPEYNRVLLGSLQDPSPTQVAAWPGAQPSQLASHTSRGSSHPCCSSEPEGLTPSHSRSCKATPKPPQPTWPQPDQEVRPEQATTYRNPPGILLSLSCLRDQHTCCSFPTYTLRGLGHPPHTLQTQRDLG